MEVCHANNAIFTLVHLFTLGYIDAYAISAGKKTNLCDYFMSKKVSECKVWKTVSIIAFTINVTRVILATIWRFYGAEKNWWFGKFLLPPIQPWVSLSSQCQCRRAGKTITNWFYVAEMKWWFLGIFARVSCPTFSVAYFGSTSCRLVGIGYN